MGDTIKAAALRPVVEAWPGITRAVGQVDTRKVANSDRVSEHSFGNALDIYGSRKAMSSLAAHLNSNRSKYDIRIICYDGGPGPSYDKCTTKHIDHLHVDFSPRCGGNIPATGTASERTDDCNRYQQSGKAPTMTNETEGGGINLNPFAGVGEAITEGVTKIVLISVGALLVIGGAVLVLKDTELGKTVKGAAKTFVTKGAA